MRKIMSENRSAKLKSAQAAKDKALQIFGQYGKVVGVGITMQNETYAVKVNFESKPQADDLPSSIDGVPVVVEVVGSITKR